MKKESPLEEKQRFVARLFLGIFHIHAFGMEGDDTIVVHSDKPLARLILILIRVLVAPFKVLPVVGERGKKALLSSGL
jgi:hypothetical protein